VEHGPRSFDARDEELGPSARADLWPDLVAGSPALGEFQRRTSRQIPVLTLTAVGEVTIHAR
jgi:hypothetical protein